VLHSCLQITSSTTSTSGRTSRSPIRWAMWSWSNSTKTLPTASRSWKTTILSPSRFLSRCISAHTKDTHTRSICGYIFLYLYPRIHIYIYACTHTHVHNYVCMHIYLHKQVVYIHILIHIHIFSCIYVCRYYQCVCEGTCITYIHTHIYVYMYTYIYIYAYDVYIYVNMLYTYI